MSTCFRAAFASSLIVLSSAYLAAQDLTGNVVRDPSRDLVTYTFAFNGPPAGAGFLYGSLGVQRNPLQISGIFNALELDPFSAAFVCPVIFDPLGHANCQLRLPMQQWEHFNLHFQALVIDPASNVAFTPAIALIQGAAPVAPAPVCIEWSGSYSRNPDTYTLRVLGPPGTNVRLLVNGGQKAIGMGVIPAGGTLTISVPVTLVNGDGMAIEKDGQVVRTWVW